MRWCQGVFLVLLAGVLAACVGRTVVDQPAEVPLTYPELISNTEPYIGRTVVMGGYVLSVENLENATRMVAVQAPLGSGQKPKSKDLSQGRLILMYAGFLDPEVYAKDRKITVSGTLSGSSTVSGGEKTSFPYLEIQVAELHLWPVEKPPPPYPYWDDPWYPFYYPWGWRYHHPWRP